MSTGVPYAHRSLRGRASRAGLRLDARPRRGAAAPAFGGALENAIEACQRIPPSAEGYAERFISVKSKVDKGRLVVRIDNSFDSRLAMEEGKPRSSKDELGGVGLDSLLSVVDRHRGSSSIDAEGSVFTLSAVLCLGPAADAGDAG